MKAAIDEIFIFDDWFTEIKLPVPG